MTAVIERQARLQPRSLSEGQWNQWVYDTARGLGWLSFHTFDSRRSTPGFPDLAMVRNGRLIFAELKAEGEKPTRAQREWLDELGRCLGVDVYVWKPSDVDEVLRVLA